MKLSIGTEVQMFVLTSLQKDDCDPFKISAFCTIGCSTIMSVSMSPNIKAKWRSSENSVGGLISSVTISGIASRLTSTFLNDRKVKQHYDDFDKHPCLLIHNIYSVEMTDGPPPLMSHSVLCINEASVACFNKLEKTHCPLVVSAFERPPGGK